MCAAVCVMVTVPTEAEELKLYPKPPVATSYCSSCGGCVRSRCSEAPSIELCERCWRLTQIAGSSVHCEAAPLVSGDASAPKCQSRALQLPNLKEDASLEQLLRAIAQELRLEDVFWSHDIGGRQLQARFDLLQDERYEMLLCTLQDWGVGERPGTHVSALTCLETRAKPGLQARPRQDHDNVVDQHQEKSQGWQSFMDSVRCRLNVNQVVRQVRRDATLTFDFVVLLMAAALLSCVGLVENSFLFLSSSMLISPLMGPIIAAIFGSVIGDRDLRWLGLKNELLGIAASVIIGFVFGGIVCAFGHFFAISTGLTEEIVSRCDTHSLAIGVCTALASGAAGAIAVLGGNTGSLVGVAISASLLPPAVNAGLLWALAIGVHLLPADHEPLASLVKHRLYSSQLSVELLVCAAVSMGLTLLNIICVWLMGVLVLRIKEVAPAVQRHQKFWRHDVRTAREVALLDPALQSALDRLDESQLDADTSHYQRSWSPGIDRQAASHTGIGSYDINLSSSKDQPNNYHTVHGFQEFCITLHRLKSAPKVVPPPTIIELFTRPAPNSDQTTTGGSGFSSCRSLPDISSHSRLWPHGPSSAMSIQGLCFGSARSEDSGPAVPTAASPNRQHGKRSVHWRQEKLERDLVPRNEVLNSRDSSPLRGTGQVLLPLPRLERHFSADRTLNLLHYGRPGVASPLPEQDEFQA
ncbi:uncharacterized protein LOC6526227 [Drosophila yakuba]|uniref:4Fe-4S ferredoxin-type domain-containing protein n=1 Tax=Drosophila yakuba TaxID=7245 RepID=B4PZL6_DROYA|nr:uncharacterized protein LOC6526227 [Drosophila yakuba]EDX03144.1 uncharacterized protein Dyak_GE15263 [Drosophila yakuba]